MSNKKQEAELKIGVKVATLKREFVSLYQSDLTMVVLRIDGENALVRPLNFPDRDAKTMPFEHLNIFDEF